MKHFIFIAALVTILSIFFIASPTEAADEGFPIVLSQQAKREFAVNIRATLLENIDFKNITTRQFRGFRQKVIDIVEPRLKRFENGGPTTTSSLKIFRAQLVNITKGILLPIRKIVENDGRFSEEQITNIEGGTGDNVAKARKIFVSRLKSQSCKKNDCKNIEDKIIKEVLGNPLR